MNTALWLAAGFVCAQIGSAADPNSAIPAPGAPAQAENVPAPRSAESKIVSVTVYQGQALVTREVTVPQGDGILELVVTPLPPKAVDSSLYTEGAEGLRVLSTRFRTRAVKQDTRKEVRAQEELLKSLAVDAQKIQAQIAVEEKDLHYLEKLEAFTGTSLAGLTEKGRLDSEAILTLSKFVMETRGAKSRSQTDLRQQLQANTESADFARKQLAELSAGSSRTERDAVIVVNKTRPEPGTVRLGYLVSAANWWPQYRLRGAAENAPVRLEYLAAVVQQTGEPWPDVRVTLSTARPSLDSAPPELLPLKMAVVDPVDSGPIEASDDRSQRISAELGKLIDISFPDETPLEDVLKYIRGRTKNSSFPDGIPTYVDPVGLQESEKTMQSPVAIDLSQVPLRTVLKLMLKQLGMTYRVQDGVLRITSQYSEDLGDDNERLDLRNTPYGIAGMGNGMGMSLEQAQAAGGAILNQAAASDQAEELRVADGQGGPAHPGEKDGPSVTFPIAGRLDIPSRRDSQLLEVARVEMPADYFAKAVPVLTARVYRLAKLTNTSEFILLPGEATVYVGSDFVGRMRLPLVAAGEPFIAGFGVDPQVQVSRRLVHKSRSVQGGNQVFDYEFRLGLRNYRSNPVKIQLWDRLPKAKGETVAASLIKTSRDLSIDALYQRTAKMDNLLRWDVDVPAGTIGDKTMYLDYEFRLEYARDLPQPRFVSGGLREGPIGGGAMGMGGMGGGMRSVLPAPTRPRP